MGNLIDTVEDLLEEGKLQEASDIIQKKIDSANIIEINYCVGRVCKFLEDYDNALKYLNNALSGKSFDRVIYAEIGDICEILGRVNDAENAYCNMLELEGDKKNIWSILGTLADLYEKHHMYLKMEKIGKRLKLEYETNYLGYHVLYKAKAGREKYIEAEYVLKDLPQLFKDNPLYHFDFIDCYERQNNFQEILKYFEKHKKFTDEYEDFALKKKILAYSSLKQYSNAEQCLVKLAQEFGDYDSFVSIMILLASKEEYEKAIDLGVLLLENIEEENILYIYFIKVVTVISELCVIKDVCDKGKKDQLVNDIDDLMEYMEDNMLYSEDMFSLLENMKNEML